MRAAIEECIKDMQEAVTPREIHKVFPINWDTEVCEFAGIKVNEGNLTRNP
jgi:hypothetical protein